MYYETVMHVRRPVSGPDEAADIIHRHDVRDFDALVWTAPDGREFCVVADNHCNNPWLEAAVIDLTNGVQIESITMGWIDTAERKAEYLRDCQTGEFSMGRKADLPLDGSGDDAKATFECGCCGSGFESTLRVQRKYDQDNGYGICPRCCRHYD